MSFQDQTHAFHKPEASRSSTCMTSHRLSLRDSFACCEVGLECETYELTHPEALFGYGLMTLETTSNLTNKNLSWKSPLAV